MARTSPVMTRIEPKTKKRLQSLAENMNRSEAYLVSEAIESYVAANEWQVALIRDRLAEARAGGSTLTQEEVENHFAARAEKRRREAARPQAKARRGKA